MNNNGSSISNITERYILPIGKCIFKKDCVYPFTQSINIESGNRIYKKVFDLYILTNQYCANAINYIMIVVRCDISSVRV